MVQNIIIAVLAVAVIVLLVTRPKVVTLTESKPRGVRPMDKVLKLSNELAPYVRTEADKISIKVVK